MTDLALYLFGPPRIERDGRAVTTDTRKAIALLAYLAVTQQRHSRDALAALLWPDYDQSHARATLRRTLSALNKALEGGWLSIERESIGLDQTDFWSDVGEFRTSIEVCQNHHHATYEACGKCVPALDRAITLYHDDFLAGFSLQDSTTFDDWQFYQTDTLRRELSGALERLVHWYTNQGELSTALLHARRLLTLDRLHEPAHRYLMQLYAWSGQRSAALHQYQECVRILDIELGVAPLEATIQLYESIKENHLPTPPVPQQQGVAIEAVSIREKAGEDVLPLTTPAFPGGSYQFVGRQREWDTLMDMWGRDAGRGRIVAFDGEAGIGKTRLAQELIRYARTHGALIVTVRCYEGEMDLAYGPIVAGLRAAISQQSTDWHTKIAPHWLSEATRLLPELAVLRPDLPVPAPLESPGTQARFLEGLLQVWFALLASNAQSPGLAFFDDIHWADETSLEFLSYLARRLADKSLWLVLTWRNPQQKHIQRFYRQLIEAHHRGEAWLFTLNRLDQMTIEQLVQQVTDNGIALPAQTTRRLSQETEGVPLFLTEYLNALTSGLLHIEDDDWDLPGGIRDLLASRLLTISETSRQLLTTAAIIGRSFDFDTLYEASGRSEEETVMGLEELIGQGLIAEMRNTRSEQNTQPAQHRYGSEAMYSPIYDFCHEKLRQLVYEEITLARRRLLHRRTAEALLTRLRGQRELDIFASQIAHHYQRAGNHEAAARYFLQAGEYARGLYASTEALAHFRSALALGYPESPELYATIGDLYTSLGSYEAALKSYQEAAAHTSTLPVLASLQHKQGRVYERRGNWEKAEESFASALELLKQAKEPLNEEQAQIYVDWSLCAHHQEHLEQAQHLAEHALELASQATDQRALAQAHNMLGILANSRDDMQQAYFHLERSLELAEHLKDISIRTAALNNLALACKADHQISRAIKLTETALALCSSQGDLHREAALHSNLADLFYLDGHIEDSMDQLKRAAQIYTEIDVEAQTLQPEIWKLVEW